MALLLAVCRWTNESVQQFQCALNTGKKERKLQIKKVKKKDKEKNYKIEKV